MTDKDIISIFLDLDYSSLPNKSRATLIFLPVTGCSCKKPAFSHELKGLTKSNLKSINSIYFYLLCHEIPCRRNNHNMLQDL